MAYGKFDPTLTVVYETTLATVAAASTGSVVELIDVARMRIVQLEVACSSSDFDFMIMNRSTGTADTRFMSYKNENNNKWFCDDSFPERGLIIHDTAGTKIYAQVKNDDGANATGTIYVRIYYQKD